MGARVVLIVPVLIVPAKIVPAKKISSFEAYPCAGEDTRASTSLQL